MQGYILADRLFGTPKIQYLIIVHLIIRRISIVVYKFSTNFAI